MYFLEVMDYYTRENNDEKEMLKLLYQSLRALGVSSLNKRLVQYTFEIKALILNGEYPGIPEQERRLKDTVYTMNYIESSSVEKLYTFTVTAAILEELQEIAGIYRKKYMDREFKSLVILEDLM